MGRMAPSITMAKFSVSRAGNRPLLRFPGFGEASFQSPRLARERDLEAVPGASRGPPVDDREDGDHAPDHDGDLFRLSLVARAHHAAAVA